MKDLMSVFPADAVPLVACVAWCRAAPDGKVTDPRVQVTVSMQTFIVDDLKAAEELLKALTGEIERKKKELGL